MTAPALKLPHVEGHVQPTRPLRIIIAGGGTGGHLYPGIAIAEAFLEWDAHTDVRFVGSKTGIEAQVLPREGWPALLLDASRIRGGGAPVFISGIAKIPVGITSCVRYFLNFQPDLVIGVGGYASGAAMLAAALCDVPRVVQEQNVVAGITNRVTARLSERVYASAGIHHTTFGDTEIRTFGNPIRRAIRDALVQTRGKRTAPTADRPFRLLVVGGSQGARFLNQRVPELVFECKNRGLQLSVVHQTGPNDETTTRELYEKQGINADVRPYIIDMAGAYANADMILCRAGASTLAEITAVGLPAILVPFPFAAHDHQTANARTLERAGAAMVVTQSEWDTAKVTDRIAELTTNTLLWSHMAKRSLELGNPYAANQIVTDCIELLERLEKLDQ